VSQGCKESGENMWWHNLASVEGTGYPHPSLQLRTILLDWKCLTRRVTYVHCSKGFANQEDTHGHSPGLRIVLAF